MSIFTRTPEDSTRNGRNGRKLMAGVVAAGALLSACASGSGSSTHPSALPKSVSAPKPSNPTKTPDVVRAVGSPIVDLCSVTAIGDAVSQDLSIATGSLSCNNDASSLSDGSGELADTTWQEGISGQGGASAEVIVSNNSNNYFQRQENFAAQSEYQAAPFNISTVPNIDGLQAVWIGESGQMVVSDGQYDVEVTVGVPNGDQTIEKQAATSLMPVVISSSFS